MLEEFLGLGQALSPLLLVVLGAGAVLCRGALGRHGLLLLVRLMQCLPSRLMAPARAAVARRSTPVSSNTSSSHPTPPPPRTGEAVALLPGRASSRVTAPDLPFVGSVGRRESSIV